MVNARGLRVRLWELGIVIGIAIIGGVLVIASGIVPVKASSRHWPITHWILKFASGRSIAFHSSSIPLPPLDSPEGVRLGAATFRSNCAWCHGSPLEPQPVVTASMTPPPPSLWQAASRWEPQELFYIAKHGIKFTGMPAWPTQKRDREIWPLISFLQKLKDMTADDYQALMHVPLSPTLEGDVKRVIEGCAVCHGARGRSIAGPGVPHLNGQNEKYLTSALQSYRDGSRVSGIMQPIASRLTQSQVLLGAKYYAERSADEGDENAATPESRVETEGQRLIRFGDRQAKIPSCSDCHGPSDRLNAAYPKLIGQSASYIEEQLEHFAHRTRGGPESKIMYQIADKLTREQRQQIAAAYEAWTDLKGD